MRSFLGPRGARLERLQPFFVVSISAVGLRKQLNRFDPLPGSLGSRCSYHRVPPSGCEPHTLGA
eukprot:10302562-Alexandrium_andersonii.AAC.1